MSFATEIGKNANKHDVLRISGIKEGDELAKRSSAMSDVAEALGFPNLVVKSQRMILRRGNRDVAGVMIETAGLNMIDSERLQPDDPFYRIPEEQFNSRELLSSLADLQVLDYLCGNTDRHAANFFLNPDFTDPANPKLLGVQGIDNDNSFGKLEGGGRFNLASLANLKIITPAMAKAVAAMGESDLENLLKPYKFAQDQIQAAKTRLKALQNEIKISKMNLEQNFENYGIVNGKYVRTGGNSKIHIVQEQDWESITLQSLVPSEEIVGVDDNGKNVYEQPKNIFWFATDYIETAQKVLAEKKKEDSPNKQIVYNEQKPEIANPHDLSDQLDLEKFQSKLGNEKKKIQDILNVLDHNGGNQTKKRSKEFNKMYTALNTYLEKLDGLEKLGKSLDLTMVTTDDEGKKIWDVEKVKKWNQLNQAYKDLEKPQKVLQETIESYLGKWHIWGIKPDNQRRIDAAQQLKELVTKEPESAGRFRRLFKDRKPTLGQYDIEKDRQTIGKIENQIYGSMKYTLWDNLKGLKVNDPVRVMGQKALEAQKRLWSYSLSTKTAADTRDTASETRIRVSPEELKNSEKLSKKINSAASDPADMKQVYQDMRTIWEYADELQKKGNQAAQNIKNQIIGFLSGAAEKNSKPITPKDARLVLYSLHGNETNIANQKKAVVREKNEIRR